MDLDLREALKRAHDRPSKCVLAMEGGTVKRLLVGKQLTSDNLGELRSGGAIKSGECEVIRNEVFFSFDEKLKSAELTGLKAYLKEATGTSYQPRNKEPSS